MCVKFYSHWVDIKLQPEIFIPHDCLIPLNLGTGVVWPETNDCPFPDMFYYSLPFSAMQWKETMLSPSLSLWLCLMSHCGMWQCSLPPLTKGHMSHLWPGSYQSRSPLYMSYKQAIPQTLASKCIASTPTGPRWQAIPRDAPLPQLHQRYSETFYRWIIPMLIVL